MPKSTLKDRTQTPSKGGENINEGRMAVPDTAKESGEGRRRSHAQTGEENVVGEEKLRTETGSNDEPDETETFDDEAEYAGKPPGTLLEEGKRFFREKKWLQAAEYFSRAVESKVKELNSADFHPDLGTFYLWFGDVLLIKEEQQAELFRFNQHQQKEPAPAAASSTAQQLNSTSGEHDAAAAGEATPGAAGEAAAKPAGEAAAKPAGEGAAGEAAAGTVAATERAGNAAGKVSDEELAFEILEMARKCLAMKLEGAALRGTAKAPATEKQKQSQEKKEGRPAEKEKKEELEEASRTPATAKEEKEQQAQQEQEKACEEKESIQIQEGSDGKKEGSLPDEVIRETVMDLSFAHVRLGDMQLMNEKYEEAAQDYAKAVRLREEYELPEQTIIAPLLCLAQATFFSGRKEEALSLFQRTYSVGCRISEGALAMPEGMTPMVLKETLEDLTLQIVDLEKQIEEEKTAARGSGVQTSVKKGSQSEAKDCIAKTTSSFDVPQLANTTAAPVTVFKISPAPSQVETHTHSDGSDGVLTAAAAAAAQIPVTTTDTTADKDKPAIDSGAADGFATASESQMKKRRVDLKALRGTQEQVKEQ